MVAPLIGVLGLGWCWYFGTQVLGWTHGDTLLSVLIANGAGFLAIVAVLGLEQRPGFWRWRESLRPLPPAVPTWVIFWWVVLGVFWVAFPRAYDPGVFGQMIVPWVLSNGLMLPYFGMFQDRWVKVRARSRKNS